MGGVISYLQRPYKVRSPRDHRLGFFFVTWRWQYVQRDQHFVDQSDFARMRTIYRPGRRVRVPAWANNQAVIRHVLCARAWTLLHSYSKPMPPMLNYKFLDSQVSEVVAIRAKANPCESNLRMLAAVRRAGTYLQLNSIILWRAWRLGEDCVTIADDLGLAKSAVHGMLNRLRDTAARLGLDGTPARQYRAHKFTPEECARGARKESAKRSAAISAANRRRWKDPAYRAHMAAKLSAAMRGNKNAEGKAQPQQLPAECVSKT